MEPTRVRESIFLFALVAALPGLVFAAPRLLDESGYGNYPPTLDGPEISAEARAEIRAAIEANVARLTAEDRLALPLGPVATSYTWPLAPWNGEEVAEPWGISGFVDLDPSFPGFLLDYDCGERTYDLDSGYNHQGIDIFTWPWPWKKMDEEKLAVVAAAPGTIVFRQDGFFDMSCGFGGGNWNAVYVQHADGSIAWYGHMKNGSVTPKTVGETVARGEYLGIVGSSGNSTGPHLHFESYDSGNNLIEPYAGPCNALNATSWWSVQPPYYESKILEMTTGSAVPGHPACPEIETPNVQLDFTPPATVFLTVYTRDHLLGQETVHEIFYPDDTLAVTFTNTQTSVPHWAASWWWNSIFLDTQQPTGTYTWRVTFEGVSYERRFNLGVAPAGSVPSRLNEGVPLTVTRAGGDIVLEWGSSCTSSDSYYDIYQGTLGSGFYDHVREVCNAGGKSWTFTSTPAGDLYWLVVPRNQTRSGSYGTDSFGGERPQPSGALQRCAVQEFDCP